MAPRVDGAATRPSQPPRLAIGAIFKNEGPYILDWIAHHRALGIERFFIADNDSSDETSPTLTALARAGIVEHLPFPSVPGRPPQPAAYDAILRQHRGEADWIAFIDADEFLAPAPPLAGLRPPLAALAARADVGAVAVNWAVYGSAGEDAARPGLVVERFPARERQDTLINRHYKTILRPRAFAGLHATPHLFRLAPGFRQVHADGSPLAALYDDDCQGLSTRVLWAPLRLNHYVVKSREEFLHRKLPRGRATGPGRREPGFFAAHDLNPETEPVAPRLAAATRAEMQRLRGRLRAAGWTGAEPALLPREAAAAL
jgi:hypothetical protein